ncbi:MAG: hypothetical protein P8N11_07490 [Gammaproteobacteria bacterium]|jgi:hypothetical protein|nr:hypothetical protein [Gammaproteobacteria bacterium]|tara:strand:+ start:535 stop:987 length:453 start_codon:yes stop_codon:yes gene_type:complete
MERILNIIGVSAVVASLVFVGLELRQSQKLAIADQMNNRMNVLIEMNSSYTEANLDYYSAATKQPHKDSLFSNAEKGARNSTSVQWSLHENDYFQYRQGLMTEDVWQAKLLATKNDLLTCDMQDIYEWRIALVEAGFRKILENMQRDCEE